MPWSDLRHEVHQALACRLEAKGQTSLTAMGRAIFPCSKAAKSQGARARWEGCNSKAVAHALFAAALMDAAVLRSSRARVLAQEFMHAWGSHSTLAELVMFRERTRAQALVFPRIPGRSIRHPVDTRRRFCKRVARRFGVGNWSCSPVRARSEAHPGALNELQMIHSH